MHVLRGYTQRLTLAVLLSALLIYALPQGLGAQAGQAPGGFVESMTSTIARLQPSASQISQFVPAGRGPFMFPAPYNTEGYRLTIPSDCGGGDCIQQEGYNFWRNINAHQGQPVVRVFVALQNNGGPTVFTIDKATGAVTRGGTIFPSGPLAGSRATGWQWSATNPDILYAYGTSQMIAKNVATGAETVVFDLASPGAQAAHGSGPNVRPWSALTSNDGLSWVMTVRQTVNPWNDIGCAIYHLPTNAWHFVAGLGDCFVDKGGQYWLKTSTANNITKGTVNPWSVGEALSDQQGAPGHLDVGWGFFIGEDNWAPLGQSLRIWDLSQPFAAAGQGRTVHTMTSWLQDSYVQPTWAMGTPANLGTVGSQIGCSTATGGQVGGPVAREREIVCFQMDGSMRALIVAPNMTDMGASGGGIPYYKAPKGNMDVYGQYYFWITNMGGNRLEAFAVRLPLHVLTGGGSGDSTPPDVSLTAPANGATLSGVTTVSATATDNVGVAAVQFLLDGTNLGSEDTTSPFSVSWNTATTSSGAHVLTAMARDTSNNWRTSNPVTVTVQNGTPGDSTPPTVSVTAPANGSTVSGTVNVSASASDNVGVAGVQFLLDGLNLGAEDTTAPYSISWNTAAYAAGPHTITARARDAAGNTATSLGIGITIQSQGPGDTILPNVSMTAPTPGSVVTGNVTVSATATDNVGVVGVQFRLDNQNLGPEIIAAPYSMVWNSAGVTSGVHTLTAVARDAAGNSRTAAAISVTVQNSQAGTDTTPPTVSMTSPANGATVSGSVLVSANATDNVAVAQVQFMLDGANLGAALIAPPYSRTWDASTATAGSHTLTAVARDAAGNTRTATSITVTIKDPERLFPFASATAAPRGEVQRVSWTSLVNTRVYLWRLRKTEGCDNCADAGAVSTQRIPSGDGYVEFEATTSQKTYYMGLGAGSPGTSPTDLDFGLRINGRTADVYEAQTPKLSVPVAEGDLLRISVSNGLVTYSRNGTPFYTSQMAPVFPLFVRAVLMDRRAEIGRSYFWRRTTTTPPAPSGTIARPGSISSSTARPAVDASAARSTARLGPRSESQDPIGRVAKAGAFDFDFDPSRGGSSLVGTWAFDLLASAESNVTAIFLYAQPTDGSTETPIFIGALSPSEISDLTQDAGLARTRLRLRLAELPQGNYTVTALAQTATGAPYELGAISLSIR